MAAESDCHTYSEYLTAKLNQIPFDITFEKVKAGKRECLKFPRLLAQPRITRLEAELQAELDLARPPVATQLAEVGVG